MIDAPTECPEGDPWEGYELVCAGHTSSAELAKWIEDQKAAYKAGTLTPQQIQRLEVLPDWTW